MKTVYLSILLTESQFSRDSVKNDIDRSIIFSIANTFQMIFWFSGLIKKVNKSLIAFFLLDSELFNHLEVSWDNLGF